MSTQPTEMCNEVEETLADVLDGLASARLIEHIAQCDRCRDLRYEAERAAEAVTHAGADFRVGDDFAERMLAAVLAARPGTVGAEGAESDPFGPRSNDPASFEGDRVRRSGDVETGGILLVSPPSSGALSAAAGEDAPARSVSPETTAPTMLAPSGLERRFGSSLADEASSLEDTDGQVAGGNRTAFQPNVFDEAEQGPPLANRTQLDPSLLEQVSAESSGTESTASSEANSRKKSGDRFVPIHKTIPLSAVKGSATRSPVPVVEAITGKADTGSQVGGPRGVSATLDDVSSGSTDARVEIDSEEDLPPRLRGRAVTQGAAPPVPPGGSGNVVSLFRKRGFIVSAAVAMAAAAAGGYFLLGKKPWTPPQTPTAFVDGAWSGSVDGIARASADGQSGLEVCKSDKGDQCSPVLSGGAVAAGSLVRTDAKTRARLKLVDGTIVTLDRDSEVSFAGGSTRQAKVERGVVVVDVAGTDQAKPAKFVVPQGEVEVADAKVDAKFSITATERRTAVEVARNEAKVTSSSGESAQIRAGEEANVTGTGAPQIAPRRTMSDMLQWSDKGQEVDGSLKGIGELRAKKPGESQEKDRAVRLSKHAVKVRVVDVVARTEIDETFSNDSNDQLEGIYRFPLPPDAQIEKLSLEVDGKLIDGAFVDREKGAAIWRGAIHNAAPQQKVKDEIIWVPGPWRDPALLEWQRGGRFELHIFPIPAHGSRRVVLTYTQSVDQTAGIRRYSYPLGLDGTASNKIDDFSIDLQVLGLDKQFGVASRGYKLNESGSTGDGQRFQMNEKNFIPAGDLTVEYALPDRENALTTWAYQVPTAVASNNGTPQSGTSQTTPVGPAGGKSVSDSSVVLSKAEREAQAKVTALSISDDTSPYVAIAVRPKLPRWGESRERTHVIVVDSSRSMVGERFSRATRLAASIVREMDRRDTFMVLACDTTCQGMGSSTGNPLPVAREPSSDSADEVERFLGAIEPDGGSNIFTALQAARAAAGNGVRGKDLRFIYLGDGTPTVGPTKTSTIEAAVRQAIPSGDASLIAVAMGSDADTTTLQAMARGGGGVMVPYAPGQRVSEAAVDVLAVAYGSVLSDVNVELPPGLTQVTPAAMDSIPAGGEAFIYARMTGPATSGDVKLHGRVHGERFDATYPARVVSSTNGGNAFVPRLFAASKIADLERAGRIEDKEAIIALSQRFAVASRFTSLLVLESEAMFKAFGLDKNQLDSGFSGEIGASSNTEAEDAADDNADTAKGESLGGLQARRGHLSGAHRAKAAEAGFDGDGVRDLETANPFGDGGGRFASPAKPDSKPGDLREEKSKEAPPADEPAAGPRPAAPTPTMAAPPPPAAPINGSFEDTTTPPATPPREMDKKSNNGLSIAKDDDPFGPGWHGNLPKRPAPRPVLQRPADPWMAPRQGMVPMRKVFDRKASFGQGNAIITELSAQITDAEAGLKSSPDSRDKTMAFYGMLMASGRINEASELASKWAQRDALDSDALQARADVAAMSGNREKAVRILTGLADLRPGDKAVQQRLIGVFSTIGAPDQACQSRIALADLDPTDVNATAQAIVCSQNLGFTTVATALLDSVDPSARDRVNAATKTVKLDTPAIFGDTKIDAKWNVPADLDIALIDKAGHRVSWLGSPIKNVGASCTGANGLDRESCSFSGLPAGSFVVEVTRANKLNGTQPISGSITFTMPGGETQVAPFTLVGDRAEVGTMHVFFTSRLVPADSVPSFGGWRR